MKKALAIFATYYRRIAANTLGKFIASIKGEHRTSNTEHRTPNEENGGLSVPAGANSIEAEDNTLLSPRLSGERNEVRGVDKTQHSTTNIEHSTSNEELAAHSVLALHATSPAFEHRPDPGTAAVSAASRATGERDARAPRQLRAADESQPHSAPQSSVALAKEDPHLVTRDELKRELDSLRRLVESRK